MQSETAENFSLTIEMIKVAEIAMSASWPAANPERRPTYLVIDKVMATLNARGELCEAGGWMETTNIKVNTWHNNGHGINELYITWCNPNDEHDPNLVNSSCTTSAKSQRSRAQTSGASQKNNREC
jgi:hypothetical protein